MEHIVHPQSDILVGKIPLKGTAQALAIIAAMQIMKDEENPFQ
jgi:hypothetical protein